jgi:hypothetical protein
LRFEPTQLFEQARVLLPSKVWNVLFPDQARRTYVGLLAPRLDISWLAHHRDRRR